MYSTFSEHSFTSYNDDASGKMAHEERDSAKNVVNTLTLTGCFCLTNTSNEVNK